MRESVLSAVGQSFPNEDAASVMEILDRFGVEPHERERERVQLAIIKLSEGKIDKLVHFVQAAKIDYRDVLYWADTRDKGLVADDVASSLSNLAELYRLQGKYAEAEPLFKRSLAIREAALGPEHPDVALSLSGLALLYGVQGRYSEAERLIERVLATQEKALGPDHPDVAPTLENYAAVLRKTNRETEAAELEARAKAIRAKHARENPAK